MENAKIWASRSASDGYHQTSFRKFCSSSQPCRSPIRSGSRYQPSLDTAQDLPDKRRESNSKEGNYSQSSATLAMHIKWALLPARRAGEQWHTFPSGKATPLCIKRATTAASKFWLSALQVCCCLQPPLIAWDIKLRYLAHFWCSLQNPFLSIPASNYPLHSGKCWALCSVRLEWLWHRGNDH